jgi:hypothetical protein
VSSTGEELLAHIRDVFAARDTDALFSAVLVDELRRMEGAKWAEWAGRKDGFTTNTLAKLLKPFSIGPRSVRQGKDTGKGYRREQFLDAWARYLAPNRHTVTDDSGQGVTPDCEASQAEARDATADRPKSRSSNGCDGVTVGNPTAEALGADDMPEFPTF